ncbi:SGNH/GDSL hydrolase family protein [Euzebya tangerina]|uniref:SGNH/GDSL hydrolase family protein n=1 Tax=Euzebya tangerina TaxID=591198 RepID=UPI0013C344B9|nr:SGNH/GDSL hydrolase family protein [Euzebya tangerina]
MLDTLVCAVQNALLTLTGAVGRVNPLGRLREGVGITSGQVDQYRWAWEAHNAAALAKDGPLLVVLGDSAAQGIGASTPFDGWVGQVVGRMRDADGVPWRVVNLSVSGARARDVLDSQLPRLYRLGQPVQLVICAVGGNDMYRTPSWLVREHFSRLVRSLPAPGTLAEDQRTVMTTLPQGLGRRRARIAGDIVTQQAPQRGILVADLWATTGPPWQGKYAEDYFHPNDVGYGLWADAIVPAARAA